MKRKQQPLWKQMSPDAQATYRKFRGVNEIKEAPVLDVQIPPSPKPLAGESKSKYWTRAMSEFLNQ